MKPSEPQNPESGSAGPVVTSPVTPTEGRSQLYVKIALGAGALAGVGFVLYLILK